MFDEYRDLLPRGWQENTVYREAVKETFSPLAKRRCDNIHVTPPFCIVPVKRKST